MIKTAIVTGASKGIGLAITKSLITDGWFVIGISRTLPPIDSTQFHHEAIDMEDIKNLPENLKRLSKKFPNIDALICNAGRGYFGCLEELSFEKLRAVMDLNFLSQTFIVKSFMPTFKKKGSGNIIFMGSEASLQGKKMGSIYCASKFALRGFAQALRDECSISNIKVTIINPGMVETDFFENLSFSPGNHPHEHIKAEDVAEGVLMILNLRDGTVIDEINLSPQKKRLIFK